MTSITLIPPEKKLSLQGIFARYKPRIVRQPRLRTIAADFGQCAQPLHMIYR